MRVRLLHLISSRQRDVLALTLRRRRQDALGPEVVVDDFPERTEAQQVSTVPFPRLFPPSLVLLSVVMLVLLLVEFGDMSKHSRPRRVLQLYSPWSFVFSLCVRCDRKFISAVRSLSAGCCVVCVYTRHNVWSGTVFSNAVSSTCLNTLDATAHT